MDIKVDESDKESQSNETGAPEVANEMNAARIHLRNAVSNRNELKYSHLFARSILSTCGRPRHTDRHPHKEVKTTYIVKTKNKKKYDI